MAPPLASLVLLLLLYTTAGAGGEKLQVGFYSKTCPQVEMVVRSVVQKWFARDKSIPAGLLRLHFHDCFVTGCDASVLIDSTEGNTAEKDAVPNLTLRGFELIDEIKAVLESTTCREVVSCADILTLAARDVVALSGGPDYAVPLGRRDGTVSKLEEVSLPGPTFSIDAALRAFQGVGLNLTDLTTLLGAHTIGFAHCGFFNNRLYDFQETGMADPSMDTSLLTSLKRVCPAPQEINDIRKDPKVFLDQTKGRNFFSFDSGFYRAVIDNKAILQIDQELLFTDITSALVVTYATDVEKFKRAFVESITKLGSVGVLTGLQGEIRAKCRSVNNNNQNQ